MRGNDPGPTHGPQHKVLPRQGHPRRCRPSAQACDAWLKKRQDNQQADAVDLSDTSETVSVTGSTVESREVEATEVESNSVPNNVYMYILWKQIILTLFGLVYVCLLPNFFFFNPQLALTTFF